MGGLEGTEGAFDQMGLGVGEGERQGLGLQYLGGKTGVVA